jgi:IS5 family transposase
VLQELVELTNLFDAPKDTLEHLLNLVDFVCNSRNVPSKGRLGMLMEHGLDLELTKLNYKVLSETEKYAEVRKKLVAEITRLQSFAEQCDSYSDLMEV